MQRRPRWSLIGRRPVERAGGIPPECGSACRRAGGARRENPTRHHRSRGCSVLEAMKIEHALIAPFDGTVAELAVSEGDQVAENVTLARVVGDA